MKKYIQPIVRVLNCLDLIRTSETDRLVDYDTEFNIEEFIKG